MKWTWLTLGCALALACNGNNNNGGDGGNGDGGGGDFNALTRNVPIAVGSAECANGGTRVDIGLDNGDGGGTARNGVLEDGEVDAHQTICNPNLTTSDTVTKISPLPFGSAECPFGGSLIEYGLDDGSGGGTADNGMLEAGEKDGQTKACLPMPDNLLVQTTPIGIGDTDCPYGGTHVVSGFDDGTPGGTAADGVLATEEIDLDEKRCVADPATLFPPTTGDNGTNTIDTHGGMGTGSGGNAGNAGRVEIFAAGGPLPTSLEIHKNGTLTVTTSPPSVTVVAGDNPLIITSNTTVQTLATAPSDPTGQVYLLGTPVADGPPLPLYFGATPATSVQVQTGVTLAFATTGAPVYAQIAGDVRNQGTITTDNGGEHAPLAIRCKSFFNDTTGLVDQRDASLQIFAIESADAVIANRGRLLTRGYDYQGTLTTLPEDADGDPDADTGTHNPIGDGGFLDLVAAKNLYNSGTISSRGSNAFGPNGGAPSGARILLYTRAGNIENDGTIESTGGRAGAGGTAGEILIANDELDPSDAFPRGFEPPTTFAAATVRQPGSFTNTGSLFAQGGSCAGGNTDVCTNGGDGGTIALHFSGGAIRSTGPIRTNGGSPRAGSGGSGGMIDVKGRLFLSNAGDPTVPAEIALACPLDSHGVSYSGAANVDGGSGGTINLSLDATDPRGKNVDPAKIAALAGTSLLRLRLVGYGAGWNGTGGAASHHAGNGGLWQALLEPCAETVECSYTRIGERWLYSDIDLDTRGGNNNVNSAGNAGSCDFESRSQTALGTTVISASNVDLRGTYRLTGGEGFLGGTAQGGGGGAMSVRGDVAHIAFGATLDTSGGPAKGSSGNGGMAGGWAITGFFVSVTGDLTSNGGASTAGRQGNTNEGQIYGYRITVDGDITFNGAGAGALTVNASDELILNGDLTGNGANAQNGSGFAGGNVSLAANHGTGNGAITLNGATLTNFTYAGNRYGGGGGSLSVASLDWHQLGSVALRGGNCTSGSDAFPCIGGTGGTFAARGVFTTSATISLDGGNGAVSAGIGSANGGDGGQIAGIIGASSVLNNTGTWTANGGTATGSATNAANGGSGGALNVFSNSGTLQAKGGNATATAATGGDGGYISTTVNTQCSSVAGGTPGGTDGNIDGPNNCS